MEELGLADSNSIGHGCPLPMQMESELQRRQNQLAVISNLTTNVKIALVHLHQKAQQLMHNEQMVSIHGLMNEGDTNLHEDAKRVTALVKDLCGDYISTSSPANETPSKYKNVRVLNKAEAENQFTEFK